MTKNISWNFPGGKFASVKRKCTNDGSNAGNQSIKLEPVAGSLVIIQYASMHHNDGSNRAMLMRLKTSGAARLTTLAGGSVAAAAYQVFPHGGTSTEIMLWNGILTEDFEFLMLGESIAISKITEFKFLYSYVGDPPTLTEAGPTGAVFSDVA